MKEKIVLYVNILIKEKIVIRLMEFIWRKKLNKKNCYNCEKYPLCRVMTQFVQIINKECVFKSEHLILERVAENCSYYKEVK